MTHKDIREELKELDRLYAAHADNQSEESFEIKNKLRRELQDLFLSLKPHIKQRTQLQWYEPTYNFGITGNLNYIEAARNDLAHIISQYENSDSPEE